MASFFGRAAIALALISTLTCIYAAPAVVRQAAAPVFDVYSYKAHPLYELPGFAASSPSPVLMHKYYSIRGTTNTKHVRDMRYLPRFATYNDTSSAQVYADLDALLVQNIKANDLRDIEVHLNGPARVLVLLSGDENFDRAVRGAKSTPTVNGLPGWSSPRVLQNDAYRKALPPPRAGKEEYLPHLAVAVERTFADKRAFVVSKVVDATVQVDGMDTPLKPTKFTLLFARKYVDPLLAFDEPGMPDAAEVTRILKSSVVDRRLDSSGVSTAPLTTDVTETPRPNERCPKWLHDVHVVASEDSKGPAYWDTWHPVIDSIYWCYYDHDHGAYPGKGYRPPFGYTAFHTREAGRNDVSQDESHNGFKVFSFQVPKTRMAVISTVHIHVSQARRFTARRHTYVFAVYHVDENGAWEPRVRLHMKMDFGAAMVRLNGKSAAASARDAAINDELSAKSLKALRLFNVLNKAQNDAGYADSSYEQWKGRLNTCAAPLRNGSRFDINIDIENPQTAIADLNNIVLGGARLQEKEKMDGFRRNMEFVKKGFRVGLDACKIDGLDEASWPADGVFFTDTSMAASKPGEERLTARQFFKKGFKLRIPKSTLFAADKWNAHMRDEKRFGKLYQSNTEGATNRKVN